MNSFVMRVSMEKEVTLDIGPWEVDRCPSVKVTQELTSKVEGH